MNKEYIIKGKGFFNARVNDPILTGVEITDIVSGYGEIKFKGTEEQLESFVLKLYDNEVTFKVIDYFEKDSEEHNHYMYGPDNILKDLNK